MQDKCKNCNGWKGLHHYKTMQCPVGGTESPIGCPQEWMDTTYQEEDDSSETIENLLREKLAHAAEITALREFYNAVPVDVLRMKAGNGFLDMGRVDDAVAAIEALKGGAK